MGDRSQSLYVPVLDGKCVLIVTNHDVLGLKILDVTFENRMVLLYL